MRVRDIMTHAVVSVGPEMPIVEAIRQMTSHRVSGVPVVNGNGRLVGIVTEADFLHRAETDTEAPRRPWLELLLGPASRADEYARSHGRIVQDVMTTSVVTVGPDAPLAEVVGLMEENGIRRLPVVEGERVVGIVSRADLMAQLAERLGESKQQPSGDEAIRKAIIAEMKSQPWCPLLYIRVGVKAGVVRLAGTIFDERQRRALHVLVRSVAGVKRIQDELTLVQPLAETESDSGEDDEDED